MDFLNFKSTLRLAKSLLILFFFITATKTQAQVYDWAFNPSGTANDRANSITCDALGNSYVVGQFSLTIDVDPGVGVTNLTSAGERDFYVAKYDVSKNLVWAFKIGGTTADIAYGITLDASNNVYVVGTFGNTVDFDPGAGTTNLTASGFNLNGFVAKYSNSGAFISVFNSAFGGSSNVWDIGFDNGGNFFIGGNFSGTVDLNPGAGTNNVTATGSNDNYVSKFSSSGVFLSGFMIDVAGGSASTRVDLAVLPSGDYYLAGNFAGTTDFDPSASVFNLTASGTDDGFLVKYNSSNIFQWALKVGAGGYDDCRSITADASGNAYITGMFNVTVDFDPGAGSFPLTASQDDAYVAKYNANGTFAWAFKIGGALNNETGTALTMDNNDDLYVTGYFLSSNVDFNPGAGSALHSAGSGIDIFVAKYSSAGNYLWSFALQDNAGSQPVSLAVNTIALYMVGYFTGVAATIDCDPSASTANLTQIGGEDGLVAKYTHCISPNITSSPTSTSLCAFSNTAFSVSATGNGLTYQWQVNQGAGFSNISNGGVYSGATTQTLTLTGPSVGMNNWQYQCVVSGMCLPTATSAIATLTVISPPPAPLSISGNSVVCASSSLLYSVAIVPGATSYSWSLPAGWSGTSSANLTFATTHTNSGAVSVSASNACGSSSVTSLNVTVGTIPSLSSIVGGTTVCANTTQQYSLAAAPGATSYSWNISGGLSGSSSINIINIGISSVSSGTISVIATNSCGVSPSQSLSININPSPTISVNSGSICAGQSFTIIPSGTSSYTFSGGSAVVNPTVNASYSVSGTSSLGCVSSIPAVSSVTVSPSPNIAVNNGTICAGQSFTIIPSGASSYTFSGGSAVVNPTVNTSYSVSGTSSLGCVSNVPAISNVTVNALPNITVSSSSSVLCAGQAATLSAGGGISYTWTPTGSGTNIVITPTTNTSYTVTGTNANGCINSALITQTVSACTGIKETETPDVISIYPNPNSGSFSIDLKNIENVSVEIYDSFGKLVYSETISGNHSSILLNGFASGIYNIRISDSARTVYKYKLLIQ